MHISIVVMLIQMSQSQPRHADSYSCLFRKAGLKILHLVCGLQGTFKGSVLNHHLGVQEIHS